MLTLRGSGESLRPFPGTMPSHHAAANSRRGSGVRVVARGNSMPPVRANERLDQ